MYYQCERHHKIVSTPMSINELKQWEKGLSDPYNSSQWLLPKHGTCEIIQGLA
jgi:hypothetical protein